MKKNIVLLMTFVMTLFSISCLDSLLGDLQSELEDELSYLIVENEGTSGSGTSISVAASAYSLGGSKKLSEYENVLYYARYGTSSEDISDFLPISAESIEIKLDKQENSSPEVNPGLATLGSKLDFTLENLMPDSIYLFTIKTIQPSGRISHTPIKSDQGWFTTPPTTN